MLSVQWRQKRREEKRRCEMMLMNSLSEANWLSEPHSLSEAASSLSGCKTLEEDKLERMLSLLAQLACPARMLSLLALSAPRLAYRIFTYSRSTRHACWARLHMLRGPKAFKILSWWEMKRHQARPSIFYVKTERRMQRDWGEDILLHLSPFSFTK